MSRHRPVNLIEEPDEFLVAMAFLTTTDDLARGDIQRGNNEVVLWR